MSDEHRDLEVEYDTGDEIPKILPRLRGLFGRLVLHAAANTSRETGTDVIVQPEHVSAAIRALEGDEPFLAASVVTQPSAFISYSSHDLDFARELCVKLEQAGIRCFRDEASIRTGERWERELRDAIRRCRVLVSIVTANALKSDWCLAEAGAAWALEKPIFLIRRYVNLDDIPDLLKTRQVWLVQTDSQRDVFVDDLRMYFLTDE